MPRRHASTVRLGTGDRVADERAGSDGLVQSARRGCKDVELEPILKRDANEEKERAATVLERICYRDPVPDKDLRDRLFAGKKIDH